MYCCTCGYPLFGLPDTTCPECARPFEPSNPRTYDETPHARRRRRVLGSCVLGVAWISGIGAAVALVVLVSVIFGGLTTGAMMKGNWVETVVLLAAIVFGLVVVSAVGFVWTRVLWR